MGDALRTKVDLTGKFLLSRTFPMSDSPDKYARRQARSSSISTVIGISLVLFMLGMLSILVLNAQKLSNHVKENIQVQVFLKEQVNEGEMLRLKKEMDAEPYTRSTVYVSKEDAASQLTKELGEDFVGFLGYNPLEASIDLRLNADFAHPDSVSALAEILEDRAEVSEVVYSPNLVRQVNENLKKLSLILLGFSALLLLVAIALINNTIRLTIFAKRLIIRSMQLVGATNSFIQRPFILSGIVNGIYASIIAILLIMGVLLAVRQNIPDFFEFHDLLMFIELFGLVVIFGILISGISTLFAVRRYLRVDARKIH